jgi:hypothetical protein
MRPPLPCLPVAIVNADEFGIIGQMAFQRLITAPTKRARKSKLIQLQHLFSLAFPGSPSSLVKDFAIGCDGNGVLSIYFILYPEGQVHAVQQES